MMEKVAILKEDLDDADKRADNSERQVTEEPSKAGFLLFWPPFLAFLEILKLT